MSWEVLTMKSKTWFFNLGVCKNLLRRCWPLWAAYLLLAMLMLPAEVANRIENINLVTSNGNRYVLNAGIDLATIAVFVGIVAAMTMFSYLYSAKGSGMMCSLPLRRETVFLTAYITGIVPILLIDVLAVGTTWLVCLGSGAVRKLVFAQTLGLMLTANIAFYNFAVLCAVLTGSIIVLPAVYFVLNAAFVVFEGGVANVLREMVYGMSGASGVLAFLSPMVMLFSELTLKSDNTWNYEIVGMNYLLCFMAVSFLLVALAVFLLRRRHMERATDVVAVPVLKPVFKYCMTIGCAFVFCYVLMEYFFYNKLSGMLEAVMIIFLLLVGAFIGFIVSEMLMQKTVYVFKCKYKGFIISCAVIAVFIMSFELDLFGFERYVPEIDKIAEVRIDGDSADLEQKENILKAMALHQQIIDNKHINENSSEYRYYVFSYVLNNGRTVNRWYPINWEWENINNKNSDAYKLQEIANCQEAIDKRCHTDIPINEDTIVAFNVYSHIDDGRYSENNVKLSAKQAVEFYNEYLLPDIKDGKMGRRWLVENEEYYNTVSNVRFEIQLSNRSLLPSIINSRDIKNEYFSFTLAMDAERCLQWLEENTNIEALTLYDAVYSYRKTAPETYAVYGKEAAMEFSFN